MFSSLLGGIKNRNAHFIILINFISRRTNMERKCKRTQGHSTHQVIEYQNVIGLGLELFVPKPFGFLSPSAFPKLLFSQTIFFSNLIFSSMHCVIDFCSKIEFHENITIFQTFMGKNNGSIDYNFCPQTFMGPIESIGSTHCNFFRMGFQPFVASSSTNTTPQVSIVRPFGALHTFSIHFLQILPQVKRKVSRKFT